MNVWIFGARGAVGRAFCGFCERLGGDLGLIPSVMVCSKGAKRVEHFNQWTVLNDEETPFLDVSALFEEIDEHVLLVDCTASNDVWVHFLRGLDRGCAIVAANKKGAAGTWNMFSALMKNRDRVGLEATVGAGMPVVSTLMSLLDAGDQVTQIHGVLSGSMGFIMSKVREGSSMSEAVLDAKALCFLEPDPRDDLSGTDIARKALILARMCGVDIQSLTDVDVTSLVPPALRSVSVEEFWSRVVELDAIELPPGKVSYVAKVDVVNKTCCVDLCVVDCFSGLTGTQNAVAFSTALYNPPLMIQGAGAGPELTAMGMIHDVMRILKSGRAGGAQGGRV